VFEPPTEVDDADILTLVRDHWRSDAVRVEHLAVGFGAHHWRVDADGSTVLFATYDRFRQRHTPASLESAYRGAIELADAGLEFVLAPIRTRTGEVIVPVAAGALSCTPWVDGAAVGDGAVTDPATAATNVTDLARLHAATPPVGIPEWQPLVRAGLAERLARSVDTPWQSGPYGEPARTAVDARLADIADWTARYLELAEAADDRPWVATHGETHTANQLSTAAGIRLIDWESLKLAPRERDLTTLVQAGYGDQVAADLEMVELFDLEWRLSEIDEYASWFAAPHTGSADDRIAYGGLLQELARGSWWPTG
jgi:spectinomycin phosphotransferase